MKIWAFAAGAIFIIFSKRRIRRSLARTAFRHFRILSRQFNLRHRMSRAHLAPAEKIPRIASNDVRESCVLRFPVETTSALPENACAA
jgi:hypothetical protein